MNTPFTALHHAAVSSDASTVDNAPPGRRSDQRAKETPQPVHPIYQPPERVRTPDGIPSWRGEVSGPPPRITPISSTNSIIHQLLTFGSRVFAHCIGNRIAQTPNAIRRWRPPVSGHGTTSFDELGMHPIVTAARTTTRLASFFVDAGGNVDDIRPVCPGTDHSLTRDRYTPSIQQKRLPEDTESHPRSPSRGQTMSLSQRALHGASEIAIPVSPCRARAQTLASRTSRTVRLPQVTTRRLLNEPNISHEIPVQTCPNDNLSMQESTGSILTRPADATTEANLSESIRSELVGGEENELVSNAQATGKQRLQNVRPTTDTVANRSFPQLPSRDREGSGGTIRLAVEDLDRLQDDSLSYRTEEFATCSSADRPPIRGEHSSRFRSSGTPIYNNNAASIRGFDEATENESRAQPCRRAVPWPLGEPAPCRLSCDTAFRRDNVDPALGTKAIARTQASEQRLGLGMVANGTLRCSPHSLPRHGHVGQASVPSEGPAPVLPDRASSSYFPMVPMTITEASKTYCRHRITELRKRELQQRSGIPSNHRFRISS